MERWNIAFDSTVHAQGLNRSWLLKTGSTSVAAGYVASSPVASLDSVVVMPRKQAR